MSVEISDFDSSMKETQPVSRFTYHDLQLLSEYSPVTPLRVIALVDYDAFYAQCESVRLNLPDTQPLAVQQWNDIIAINYAARDSGFKRGGSVEEVKRLCPGIVLQHVATWREGESSWAYRADSTDPAKMKMDKASLDPYRIESRKTLEMVKSILPPAPLQRIEKAGIDEFFLDLSAQVHAIITSRYEELSPQSGHQEKHLPFLRAENTLDWTSCNIVDADEVNAEELPIDWDDVTLQIGAEIISDLRKAIRERMGYTCSAGIAHNKALAKLAAGYKKPNQQTVIRARAVSNFLSLHKMTSIRGLAGKLGAKAVAAFGAERIPELLHISLERMILDLGRETGTWLFDIIRGKENSEVTPRTDIQSMLSQKTFAPLLSNAEQASAWLRIFAADLISRLDDLDVETGRHRRPTVVALHHHIRGRFGPTRSKQATIPKAEIDEETLFSISWQLLQQISRENLPTWPCMALGLSIHKFEARVSRNERITSFFVKEPASDHRKRKRSDSLTSGTQEKLAAKREVSGHSVNDFVAHSESACKTLATPSPVDVEDLAVSDYSCPKCLKAIAGTMVLEHLDWHVALALQNSNS